MIKKLPLVRAGDTLRARQFNDMAKTINAHSRILNTLPNYNLGQGLEAMARSAGSAGGAAMPSALTWTETAASRMAAEHTITDSNSDTHDVAVATHIVMSATYMGQTYNWTFNFDDPA